jgi:ribose 5-phosphate isomerase B
VEPRNRLDTVKAMKISVASDHAGFELKDTIAKNLANCGHEVTDHGTDSTESVDYPLYVEPAARDVAEGRSERAILVCGSGVGVCMVANKVDGVRAVNAHDPAESEMSRRHNDANVLCLSGSRLSVEQALPIIRAFLTTEFEGGRHARRVGQIAEVEHHHAAAT